MKRSLLKSKFIILALRTVLLAAVLIIVFLQPQLLVYPRPFFSAFVPLHVLWAFWMGLFILKLFPAGHVTMAGKKIFSRFNDIEPIDDIEPANDPGSMNKYVKTRNLGALYTCVAGSIVILPFYILYLVGLIEPIVLVIYSVLLFALDVVFETVYCPFQRLIMKNRCCNVCRIYAWNSFLIMSPLLIIPSFFSWSLAFVALLGAIENEISWLRHPEYFWDVTNKKLRCAECTTKMCRIRKPVRERPLS